VKIGIAYDTPDMYHLGSENNLYYDFAELSSIEILKREIQSLEHQVELIGNTTHVMQSIIGGNFTCDLIYNTVEGLQSRNREGLLPAILETFHIPYIGTDAFGLSLTLDKAMMKVVANHLGILTPKFHVVSPNQSQDIVFENLAILRYPVILKPNYEGNSSGIVVCDNHEDAFSQATRLLEKYKSPILCEEFIFGKEITVPLIGNEQETMLFGTTTVDIQKDDSFWFDSDAKMFGDYKNIIIDLPSKLTDQFKEICYKLFAKIGCCDFARFDFRLSSDNQIYFIEANPLPSLFKGGSFDVVGQMHGYDFARMLDKIITTACKRLSIPKT